MGDRKLAFVKEAFDAKGHTLDIYLYGCSGHAKVILDILHWQGRTVTAFVDENPPPRITHIHGVPVYLASEALPIVKPAHSRWIIAIGNNRTRQRIANKLQQQGHTFTTAIHPSEQIGLGVEIASGSVVMANTAINIDTIIGHHVTVNTGATIADDCQIGDYCHVGPGCYLCGQVKLGAGVLLGVGTSVCPSVEIGAQATCEAGSVVIRSLPSHCLAYGCPAKIIQTDYS